MYPLLVVGIVQPFKSCGTRSCTAAFTCGEVNTVSHRSNPVVATPSPQLRPRTRSAPVSVEIIYGIGSIELSSAL